MAYTTIDKPSDYFNTVLYTGNSTTDTGITGVGFQPDWVWVKSRGAAESNFLNDSVRGAGKNLKSESTGAEGTETQDIKSFDSDGFTLGSNDGVNDSGFNYVSWNWKAGGSASSNTDGSITSSVSANTTAGFSIITWTGNATSSQSVGHGLGAVPKVILTKNTDNGSQPWKCYFEAVGNAKYLQLNATDAPATSGVWSSTTPTSSIISISNDTGINGSGNTILAYCFAEKKGYSKFGSYTGNGSTDGTFVHCGFRPAFLLWKQTNTGGQTWGIFDNKRDPHNFVSLRLIPNASDAEGSASAAASCDFLSNGFKWRSSFGSRNGSGGTYIYMAFAENPFVTSTGVPATAR